MTVQELVRWHLAHHRNLQVQDVYKMLYQAVFGPGHVLAHPEEAFSALAEEFAHLKPDAGELLLEPISPSGTALRLNLRPYKQRGGDLTALWQALLQSARGLSGSKEELLALWDQFAHCVRQGELPFAFAEVEEIDALLRAGGVAAMHHSDAYRRANAPAYRVLTAEAVGHLFASPRQKQKANAE